MPHTIQGPHTLALWDGPNIELKCQRMWSLYGVWPLTAFMEVKNKYAYVITQDICNKFICPMGVADTLEPCVELT